MNIFDLANQNSRNLEKKFQLLMKRCQTRNNSEVFSSFVEKLRDWRISINMTESVLNNVLIGGRYKNIYEVKVEDEKQLEKLGKSTIPREEALKRHLKKHTKPRMVFDHTFEDGEKLRFGALNFGGLGLTGFGPLCVVIKRKQTKKYTSLAFIKEDSERYVENDHVNIDRLKQDVSNKEHVHLLVVLKHQNEIERTPPDNWASMTCCTKSKHDQVYIEAVTRDEILNTHIEAVRMSEKHFRTYYVRYLAEDYESEIREDNKYRLFILRGMFIIMDKLGIKREVIDENGN